MNELYLAKSNRSLACETLIYFHTDLSISINEYATGMFSQIGTTKIFHNRIMKLYLALFIKSYISILSVFEKVIAFLVIILLYILKAMLSLSVAQIFSIQNQIYNLCSIIRAYDRLFLIELSS